MNKRNIILATILTSTILYGCSNNAKNEQVDLILPTEEIADEKENGMKREKMIISKIHLLSI